MQQNSTSPLSEILIHKEKNQKKNNKTNGQIDKLKGYSTHANKSKDNMATVDKQIQREANFIRNIDIDESITKLTQAGLLNEKYQDWYCKCMHTLGVPFVMAQAEQALSKGSNPPGLFHFLLNKAMNKHIDPYLPRFN